MINVEELKTHIVDGERCQRHNLFGKSLSTKDFWEIETLRLPNLVNATNNINVLILVLHIRLRASFRLAYTAYFIGPSGPPTGFSSPLSPSSFSSGTSTEEGETAARTTNLVSAWDKLLSSSKMTLSFDILRNSIRKTWLTGYYIVDL